MIERLKKLIWGEKFSCDDPIFGHLTTRRIKAQPSADPPMFQWFGDSIHEPRLRFARIEQIIVHAGRYGPEEAHHREWLKLLDNSADFTNTLKKEIFESYLWHKTMLMKECRNEFGDEDLSRYKSWPQYSTEEEALASRCFDVCFLDVYDDHLEFYIFNDWDEEHNLRIWVRNGRFSEMAQE